MVALFALAPAVTACGSSAGSCDTGNVRGCFCSGGSAGMQHCVGGQWEECQCSSLDLSEDRDVGSDPIHDPGEHGLDGTEEIAGDAVEPDAPFEWDLREIPEVPAGLMEPCIVSGNILHMVGDSDDNVHPGPFTAQGTAEWTWTSQTFIDSTEGYVNVVEVRLDKEPPDEGPWTVDFSSKELGEELSTGMYDDAMRYPFEDPGRPGLSIYGESRGCNRLSGWFFVFDLGIDDSGASPVLTRLSASFEQHCEEATPSLAGCIHYER
jgi:hypothetical protein